MIPIEVLQDTIEYVEYINTTTQVNYKEPVTIENVRVQFDKNYKNNDGHLMVSIDNIIFIDAINSLIDKKAIEDFDMFKVSSLIKFKGKTYTISKVEFLKTDGELHHLEIEVK